MPKASSHSAFPFRTQELKNEYLDYYHGIERAWPVDFDTATVETSFGSTYVRICGPRNAPTLVLLPGDTENSLSWKNQITALSEDHRVYMPDQINDHGLSVRSRPIKNSDDFVLWLDEFFTRLGLASMSLCGFSYGGGLAAGYAIAHPSKIEKLILFAPACRNFPIKMKTLFALIYQDKVRTRKVTTRHLYWERADAVKKDAMTKKIVDEMIEELLLSRKCFAPHYWVMPFPIKTEDWAKLGMPCLFFVGENDILVQADEVIPMLHRVAPKIETRVVTDAGHDLLIVKSDEIIDDCLTFLRRQARSTRRSRSR